MVQGRLGRALRASLLLALPLLAMLPAGVLAQPISARPVRMFVGFPPGGSTDIFARALSDELSRSWSVPVVVDNRAGANGVIGTEALTKAAPDGQTLMFIISSHVTNRALYPHLPYDPIAGVTPLSLVARTPLMLVANPRFPARTLQDVLRLAREQPGRIDYASPGQGSVQQIAMELLARMAGVQFNHIAYRGGAPAMTDLIGGVVPLSVLTTTQVLAQVQSGALRPIGVTTETRSPLLPAVPTIAESGLPGYQADVWFAVVGPAGMPAPLAARIATDIARAMTVPSVRERFTSQDATIVNGSPEDLAALMRAEDAKWSQVIRDANIRAE
ncbi:tripartite tricarboxylate transporter substrate binding protein [Plastoroseomonas hellenica]|uniref:tripartite tricarboxylate transporter substrate binding protein n=1 Tax=Plastoroseomonas hellenica TaxID=2687306 RepID=UPI001BA4765E|nr:tripartite tricarboxylate transporter substrate binding protein [Plastoroseomonas hellenica]MBR0644907.1 tripartite tricarboxylate transporter substrate binding protein [Plastoroseomonas hellenica]